MIYDGILEGKYVNLKSVMEEDAEFTLSLRQDPKLTKYLPYLDITLEQQKKWIRKQQEDPTDYFFAVFDKRGSRIGTQGVYNIESDTAEGGRLAMRSSDPFQIFESGLLLSDFIFYELKIKKTKGFIYAGNKRAVRYNRMLGVQIHPPEKDKNGNLVCRINNCRDTYDKAREKLVRILYSE